MVLKVATIITTCDRPEACETALRSVLAQTQVPDHVVIVDDGRRLRYTGSQADVQIVNTSGYVGGSAARNLGAASVRSCDILMFLDDDDIWEPNKVSRQAEHFKRYHDVVLVYTGRIVVSQDNKRILYTIPANRSGYLDKQLLIDNFVGVTSGVAVASSAFWQVRGFDEEQPARQDYDLWLRVAPLGRIIGDGGFGLRYTLADANANNISRGRIDRHANAIDRLQRKYRSRYEKLGWLLRRKATAHQLFYIAKIVRARSWWRGSLAAMKAFLCYPSPKFILIILPEKLIRWIRREVG